MSSSKQTHNHATIKAWAEEHGGVPAIVADTAKSNNGGILRIHFPKHSDHSSDLKEIDWGTFFKIFDEEKLDFLYQEKKADGEESTFHKFVARD
ncbi:1,4-alpha-glucan branching enzyme [Pedobacter kyungheensis]|uniref:1,4-alpha-glucan branching enzyme n=1 Tax=Pedobacter kyungheensis TaxID=1069985 RepID=A0A0C1D3L5_9SPHI|nr:hypothetical protein [Pedobacter kyungheensis]KIA88400.1 1,4-alpha-glucan branching enzyme [Pedobacter kyungheensis]